MGALYRKRLEFK